MGARDGSFGLIPVGVESGTPFVGHTRLMSIASAYGTNIFYGDLVNLQSDGTIQRETADAAIVTCGVFLGCSYTDATLGFVQRQYWPASQIATDAFGYIADDPNLLFKIQADATLGRTAVGANFELTTDASGSTVTGNSGLELAASTQATTNTFPLRVIDFLDVDEIDSDFPIMIVKINTVHLYDRVLGT